jgi:hypothetical protein
MANKDGPPVTVAATVVSEASIPGAIAAQSAPVCEAEVESSAAAATCSPEGDRAYIHPYTSSVWPNGQVPLLDVFDDPEGRRYALVDEHSVDAHGRASRFTGIATLEVFFASPSPAQHGAEPKEASPAEAALGGSLKAALAEADPAELIHVLAYVRAPAEPALQLEQYRALARGAVTTAKEYDASRAQLLAAKRDRIRAVVLPVADSLASNGVELVALCELIPCLSFRAPRATILALADEPIFERMDYADEPSETEATPTGSTARQVLQYVQNHEFTYTESSVTYNVDGDNGAGNDLTAAIFEPDGYRHTHDAFLDTTSSTSTRIRSGWTCNSSTCTEVTGTWPSGDFDHGTGVAGALLADLTDDQIVMSGQADRTWAGREARAYLYEASGAGLVKAYEHAAQRTPSPHVSSHSYGQCDDICDARKADSKNVCEALYQNGVLVFAAAGNDGGAAGDCKMGSAAAALCAFTVGGYDPAQGSEPSLDFCDWRDAVANSSSSRGGSCDNNDSTGPVGGCNDPDDSLSGAPEGFCRTIVDGMAPYCLKWLPDESSDIAFEAGGKCGTSYSTPLTAGMALTFVDAYKQNFSDVIDDPGVLHAWMLQMGDRSDGSFHNIEGGGRIKMRMPNDEGLDAPWTFISVETCIDDDEVYVYQLNGGAALSSDVDDITVTLWFYDRAIQNSGGFDVDAGRVRVDRIKLELREIGGSILATDDSRDEKNRVRVANVGGKALEVRVTGTVVRNDELGCGADSARVYLAILAEDDDRDDGDGPAWNGTTCEGVEPMIYP